MTLSDWFWFVWSAYATIVVVFLLAAVTATNPATEPGELDVDDEVRLLFGSITPRR